MRQARQCALLAQRSARLPSPFPIAPTQNTPLATPLAASCATIGGPTPSDTASAEVQHRTNTGMAPTSQQAFSTFRDLIRLTHRPLSTCSQRHAPLERLQAQASQSPIRQFASEESRLSEDALRAEVDGINSQFAEAREEIEMALESMDTVYFNEEAEAARAAVQVVLDRFAALQARLDEERRGAIQRSMGLKMEQLKGELEQLKPQHE